MKRITQPLQVFLAIKMLGLHEGLLDSDRRSQSFCWNITIDEPADATQVSSALLSCWG